MNFEAFLDYDAVDEEMAQALYAAVKIHRDAIDEFVADSEPSVAKARVVLEAANEVENTYRSLLGAIWTQPVMVHTAGVKKTETNPNDATQEGIFQRCARCGSVLNFWHEGIVMLTPEGPRHLEEDDVPWWDEGDIVAKSSSENGVGMYEIDPKRELEKHERECVSLNDLVGE